MLHLAKALLAFAVSASSLDAAVVNEYPDDPTSAVRDLIARMLPHHVSNFELELVPLSDDKGVMGLGSADGHVVLSGSGGVELSSAFNWYLNDYLNVTVDWNTYGEGQLPAEGAVLPLPPNSGLRKARQMPWSYYLNVCTLGYSLAFVPWSYWEKHIDWMALNGINLPLAFVGQEWLWLEVFKSYNLTLDDLTDFFSGPAFLPWYRMGNVQGWGGPITENWLVQRKDLQLKTLARMRGLGMTPVLSAFAGHVPRAFARAFPDAHVTQTPKWGGFDDEYGKVNLLEPTDPYYKELGGKFIKLQAEVFGTDHIYSCDTYNEVGPPSSQASYLASASNAVYTAMATEDSKAIWLMQGWLFHNAAEFWQPAQVRAYLSGVDDSSMWILDLYADAFPVWSSFESFYGKPFIMCTLLDFGGRQGLTGNIPQMTSNFAKATGRGAIGVGLTMEGIWTNYPAFEATLKLSWEPAGTFDNAAYLREYSLRRYGQSHEGATTAWAKLRPIYERKGRPAGSQISNYPGLTLQLEAPAMVVDLDAPPACIYSDEQDGYLRSCPGGGGNCPKYPSLDAAKAACEENMKCAGVTHSKGSYELRAGDSPMASPSGESSWVIANFDQCHPQVACIYSDEQAGYLATCPDGSLNCPKYFTLEAAEDACDETTQCTGVTHSKGNYELRGGASPAASSTGETSWAVTNVAQCHPGFLPTGPIWSTALGLLISAAPTLQNVSSYRFDLVDLSREALSAVFDLKLVVFKNAFKAGDKAAVAAAGEELLGLIDDYDRLLSTDTNFMLGQWIDWAREWGATDEEKDWLEFNARNQITLWGPTGGLNDYAKKDWGGLVRGYYKQRWNLCVEQAQAHAPNWDTAAYYRSVFDQVEQPFSQAPFADRYPVQPEGDAVDVAVELFAKYFGGSSVLI